MDKSKDFLRVTEAASMMGVDYKTVYRLIRNGKLPASKPGGIYLIRLADVNRLLEQGQVALTSTEESPLATEVLRCGQCLRLIESDAQIGGVCERESCEEILCAACWLPQNENFCHKHLPTREQRYEAARKEFAAGRLPALASAREARQMEMNFLSRFDHKVRQIATLKNPLNNSLYKNLNWDAAHTQGDAASEVMSLLNSGFLDAATLAAVPLNAYST
jgi:excisionase family DNA binding protein